MLLNEKIKFFLACVNEKVFNRNLFVIILGVLFFLLRYQFPWIVFFILTPFFYFAQKNRNFFSFVFWGILTGMFFVFLEYSFLLNISTYTYLGAIIFYGCFFSFIPFFILLFISNLINKHQWFFYPSSATIGFWLYNFTFLHYPLLSPLDGLTHYPFFLQLMNIGGEYLMIFLVGIINFCLLIIIETIFNKHSKKKIIVIKKELFYITIIILVIVIYGFYSESKYQNNQAKIKVKPEKKILLVQGNLDMPRDMVQYKKAISQYMTSRNILIAPSIYYFKIKKLISITNQFIRKEKPDLIVWPEKEEDQAMFKEDGDGNIVMIDKDWTKEIIQFVDRNKIPLLVTTFTESFNNENNFYNTTVLIQPDKDKFNQFYYKKKLFFFGENISNWLKFITRFKKKEWKYNIIPVGLNNMDRKVFYLNGMKFGLNVCFENGFSCLSRNEITQGATFIINSSNDALFQSSRELNYQETTSVFRAIENGVYSLRATNTGKTEIINPEGKIISKIKPFKSGALLAKVNIDKNRKRTIFNQWGYKFIHSLLVVYILIMLYSLVIKKIIFKNKKYGTE